MNNDHFRILPPYVDFRDPNQLDPWEKQANRDRLKLLMTTPSVLEKQSNYLKLVREAS